LAESSQVKSQLIFRLGILISIQEIFGRNTYNIKPFRATFARHLITLNQT